MERIDDNTRQGGISKIKRHVDPRSRPIDPKDRPIPKAKPLEPDLVLPTRKYKTLIRNNNPDLTVKIPLPDDYPGTRWTYISPATQIEISFGDNGYFLAPWREIEYKKNGKIMLGKRKGYTQKIEDFTCTFLNEMGNNINLEVWPSDDSRAPVYCVRGIPIKRRYDAGSYWSEFKNINFKKPEIVTVMDMAHPGQLKYEVRPVVEKIKHDKKVLERIDNLRREIALKSYGLEKEGA